MDVYDALAFRELAESYDVSAVPKIIINQMAVIEIQTSERRYRKLILKAIEHVKMHES